MILHVIFSKRIEFNRHGYFIKNEEALNIHKIDIFRIIIVDTTNI